MASETNLSPRRPKPGRQRAEERQELVLHHLALGILQGCCGRGVSQGLSLPGLFGAAAFPAQTPSVKKGKKQRGDEGRLESALLLGSITH